MRILIIIGRLLWFACFLVLFMLTGLALLPCMAWDFATGTQSADRLVHWLEGFLDLPYGKRTKS